jgi:hypothetical protein
VTGDGHGGSWTDATVLSLDDGAPIVVTGHGDRIGQGPWARWLASAVVPDESSSRAERGRALARSGAVADVTVAEGAIAASVTGPSGSAYAVALHAATIPASAWAAAVRAADARVALEAGVAGTAQSVHLAHMLETEVREPLIPPARRIAATCTCPDRERTPVCKHIAALAFAVANAVDRDPSILLRWRGCRPVEPPAARSGDPWAAGRLPAPRPPRSLPPGAVVKRLGRSGIRVGGRDLAEALEPAYRAFAESAVSRPASVTIDTWSNDSAS